MATMFPIPSTHPRATSEVDNNSTKTVTSSLVLFDKTTPTGTTQYWLAAEKSCDTVAGYKRVCLTRS